MGNIGRIRDLLLETLLAAVLVGAFVAFLFAHPKGVIWDWRRITQTLNTIVVFGFLISWFRNLWGSALFWASLAALFVGHIGIYALIFNHAQRLPLAVYGVLNLIELTFFAALLNRLQPQRK